MCAAPSVLFGADSFAGSGLPAICIGLYKPSFLLLDTIANTPIKQIARIITDTRRTTPQQFISPHENSLINSGRKCWKIHQKYQPSGYKE